MLCRLLLIAVLFGGFTAMAVAQNPDEDAFGGSSDNDGAPRDRGDRGRGDSGDRGDRGDRGRGRGPAPNLMFEAIDIDGDGTITAKELKRAIVGLKKLDTDGDGNLTLDEVTPQRGPGGPGGDPNQFIDRIMENDLNGDGLLTPDEVPEQLARMLTGADLNADGAIDRAELGQAMQSMRDRRGGPGGPGGFGGRGAASNPEDMTKQLMAGDRNGDGMLSPDEVSPQALGMLRDADTNGDGHLNAKEVRQAMETARGRMQRFQGGQGQGGFDPSERARRRPQQ
ncbi:EF-hand domain-containing protein [Bythopirellula polymerisocia]|uniref:Transaldolase/EF-hand domain-containing protein n=1 Tax=Bythopirellula polymerisocia TaxID=2528003 RepID=A0A5C6CZS9_9BACT|nr:EF-hand domain-containing protein [Bythopirellula polymerisocia]TWU29435.1 transaldolase/EF-hand domain-containing protein [Bythopirellula polymerisocia]